MTVKDIMDRVSASRADFVYAHEDCQLHGRELRVTGCTRQAVKDALR